MITEFVDHDKRYAIFTIQGEEKVATIKVNFHEKHSDDDKTAIMAHVRSSAEAIDANP